MYPLLFKHATLIFCVLLFVITSLNCGGKKTQNAPSFTAHSTNETASGQRIILDFEDPNPPVAWETGKSAASTPTNTEPATTVATSQPSAQDPPLVRSSVRPNTGLWALKATLAPADEGSLVHRFAQPVNLSKYDILTASVMHTAGAARSGEWRAAVYLTDEDGKKVVGDPYPIVSRWRTVPLDLKTAGEEGLDISRIVEVGLQLVRGHPTAEEDAEPLEIQTDTWLVQSESHVYIGQKYGPAKSFYVQREGTRLEVGMVGHYEVDFFQRSGADRPWMTIRRKGNLLLGQPGTGLMLLNQDQYDTLSLGVRQDAYVDAAESQATLPRAGWPLGNGERSVSSEWTWECTWTSPVATIVEVRQTVGPFDQLGQPAAELKWRFMIYQWGEVFVHVEWTKGAAPNTPRGDPITWALVLDRTAAVSSDDDIRAKSSADADRLLDAIYPAAIRDGLAMALPDRMQKGAAVAMIAKTTGTRKNWWWTTGDGKRVFGVGVSQGAGPLDCMLLVNAPTALMQAGSFSQYLVPPKIRVRQGEVDRNFPGDADNDGLVEPYGFQVIRLANARTSFTIYPQERPLFYPPYLFTVPAVERDADDLKNSRMLINIDGQQFTDPPQFPDGSFLLQMPYVIDRPVQVEGILVKK